MVGGFEVWWKRGWKEWGGSKRASGRSLHFARHSDMEILMEYHVRSCVCLSQDWPEEVL